MPYAALDAEQRRLPGGRFLRGYVVRSAATHVSSVLDRRAMLGRFRQAGFRCCQVEGGAAVNQALAAGDWWALPRFRGTISGCVLLPAFRPSRRFRAGLIDRRWTVLVLVRCGARNWSLAAVRTRTRATSGENRWRRRRRLAGARTGRPGGAGCRPNDFRHSDDVPGPTAFRQRKHQAWRHRPVRATQALKKA